MLKGLCVQIDILFFKDLFTSQLMHIQDLKRFTSKAYYIYFFCPFSYIFIISVFILFFFPSIFHRHVVLPKEMVKLVPRTHLLSEQEWRAIGVQQSQGWVHYMIHDPGMYSEYPTYIVCTLQRSLISNGLFQNHTYCCSRGK